MRQLTYPMFISNNRISFHLWCKEDLVKIKESQNIMKMIVDCQKILFSKNQEFIMMLFLNQKLNTFVPFVGATV